MNGRICYGEPVPTSAESALTRSWSGEGSSGFRSSTGDRPPLGAGCDRTTASCARRASGRSEIGQDFRNRAAIKRASAITSVASSNFAVAAMNRSAGSQRASESRSLSNATACVMGASRNGARQRIDDPLLRTPGHPQPLLPEKDEDLPHADRGKLQFVGGITKRRADFGGVKLQIQI